MFHLKYVLDHFLAFLLSILSAIDAAITRIALWWELRNNHGRIAVMLFYAPELDEHQADNSLFGNLQRKFETSSGARFMRFDYKYNQQFCKSLGIDRSCLPVVICEWSRLVQAINHTQTHRSPPIPSSNAQTLEQKIQEFITLSTELARCRHR